MKEHISSCSGFAHWCVFNSLAGTVAPRNKQHPASATQTVLVCRIGSWWFCSFNSTQNKSLSWYPSQHLHMCSITRHRCHLVCTTSSFRVRLSECAVTCSLHLTYAYKDDKNTDVCTESEKRELLRLHLRSKRKKKKRKKKRFVQSAGGGIIALSDTVMVKWNRSSERAHNKAWGPAE